ncbi:barstar family protein [Granulicella mallensis]|uniref:Barstar (Barnase inhibitor) n=1 Tax=Granulicella mallensis (strain ATCC BAA-1857 / DSM 23137 / MP5ACTX8) TaxID=682795 RepID=G8NS26_GRAMM|nr:barstar family protein [Granulicella mallensis]AEU36234.1 Barstar (barnase inhibitor) [Granulicella mallensis MP5ACTX8]
MAAFISDSKDETRLDWAVLRDGGISLYLNHEFLNEDVMKLQALEYSVKSFDCSTWLTPADMHDSLQNTLEFPSYYGRNFNALNDCLQDLEVPFIGGLSLVFRHFDRFANASPENQDLAFSVLDLCVRASRTHMLTGRRFLTLVQSDDPTLQFEGLGAIDTPWNRRECLAKNRNL